MTLILEEIQYFPLWRNLDAVTWEIPSTRPTAGCLLRARTRESSISKWRYTPLLGGDQMSLLLW